MMVKKRSDKERFESHILKGRGCWIWGAGRRSGRGQFGVDGKKWMAHRFSYTTYVGAIPPGLCVCHHCDTPLCVRPSHLFLGTHKDNTQDMVRKGRDRHFHKLTLSQVVAIKSCIGMSARKVGEKFSVHQNTIYRIRHGECWRNI